MILTFFEEDQKPRLVFYELREESTGTFESQTQINLLTAEPSLFIEGAEMFLEDKEDTEHVHFLTSKGLIEGDFIDPSLSRLSSPTLVKRIAMRQI